MRKLPPKIRNYKAENADDQGFNSTIKGEDTSKVEPNAVGEEEEEGFGSFEDFQMVEVVSEDIKLSTELTSGQGPENLMIIVVR